MERPPLVKGLPEHKFRDFYWLKKELQSFCRDNGLSTSGSKDEITERIGIFLREGKIIKPRKRRTIHSLDEELYLETVITEHHRCSQKVRAFFKLHISNFHFSTYIQNYFKNNVGKTYQDVIEAWLEEEKRKKEPTYRPKIGSQFQYNQFIRDYFADPKNKGRGREDAILAWKHIKSLPGDNRYRGEE
jgi:hypothetical protein